MRETVCILCGTNDHAVHLYDATVSDDDLNPTVFSARRMPDRVHGEILRCTQCGLVYPRRLVDPAILSELYRRSRFTYGGEEPYIRKVYTRYLRKLLPLLKTQPRPHAYLDIGCGNGFMLTAARELGFDDVCGVEPSEDAAAKADASVRPSILTGMFSPELIGARRFDAITCFQTLDHIPDPAGFVRQCFDVLKPGGTVLFINHNIGSWTARLLGKRCPMLDIEHTFLHTPETMRMLFARAGFVDIDVFAVRNDYPLAYWLHLVPGPRGIKQNIIGLLQKMLVGNIVIPLYAGNLGLVARKS